MAISKQPRFVIVALAILFSSIFAAAQVDFEIQYPASFTNPLYQFTSRLLSTLNDGSSKSETENIIVSPISVHKALNMVLLGVDENTSTRRELLNTMGYASLSEAEVQKCHEDYARVLARFRNAAENSSREMKQEQTIEIESYKLGQKLSPKLPVLNMFDMMITHNGAEILPEYRSKLKQYYKGTIENVDDGNPETKTQIMEQVNSWGQGAGFNKPILEQEDLSGNFEAILLNGIHMQVAWVDTFYESQDEAIFYQHGLRDKPVDGPKLTRADLAGARYLVLTDEARAQFKGHSEWLRFRQLSYLNAQIVQVPMKGGLTFTIFEPLEHSTPGNNQLVKLIDQVFSRNSANGIQGTQLAEVLQLLDGPAGDVGKIHLTMPKFKFENEMSLVEVLQSMGLKRAFDPHRAEISGITRRPIYISDVKHQAMIDVNAKGIKAAAATLLQFTLYTCELPVKLPLRVSIKRPFVFLIRHGEIPLFVGQLSSL